MPWQKNYNKNHVLDEAMMAFWTQGYTATSINDLVAATGLNRGSLYAEFEGKHELFMEALRHYDRVHRVEHLQRHVDEHAPLEAITTLFAVAAKKPANGMPRGCLLVNTALEMSPHDTEIAGFVNRSLHGVEKFFRDRLDAAQREGDLDPATDISATAKTLLGLFLGLRVLNRGGAPRTTVSAVVEQARALLK